MSEPDFHAIDVTSDDHFMGEALRQARMAYDAGEVPVGAVIVREGRFIAKAFNQVELLKDARRTPRSWRSPRRRRRPVTGG